MSTPQTQAATTALPRPPSLRVIPRLDIKGPNLVKGIHLEGLRVLGPPAKFARAYYEQGADELLFVDIVASLYGRNQLLPIVEQTAREVFIPLTVAGGLRSIDDIRSVLRAGADKVALNTAAVRRPEFIREAAHKFGSSTIVLSIEAIRRADGSYEAYTDNGREKTGLEVFDWAARAVELGAGEVLVTAVDREGTGLGFDLELCRRLAEMLPVPVIACGGAATAEHVQQAAELAHVQAVALASVLHYHVLRKSSGLAGLEPQLGRPATISSKFADLSLVGLKQQLAAAGTHCRVLPESQESVQ
jgi:cyclase